MDRLEQMLKLIKDENISINDEVAYGELLNCADDITFEKHVEATKEIIDDFKVQYQYVVDQADNGDLSVKAIKVDEDKGDTEKKEEESSDKGETEKKEDDSKKEDTEKKEEESSDKGETEKKESSEKEDTEKKEEKDTDTTKTEEKKSIVDNDDILSRMSELLEAVMSGKQQYGRLEETFKDLSKNIKEELETLSKKMHNVSKKLKDVENSQFNVSKSLGDDESQDDTETEGDLFNSVFQNSPLQTRFENSHDASAW